jgi:hypothetical protein
MPPSDVVLKRLTVAVAMPIIFVSKFVGPHAVLTGRAAAETATRATMNKHDGIVSFIGVHFLIYLEGSLFLLCVIPETKLRTIPAGVAHGQNEAIKSLLHISRHSDFLWNFAKNGGI